MRKPHVNVTIVANRSQIVHVAHTKLSLPEISKRELWAVTYILRLRTWDWKLLM